MNAKLISAMMLGLLAASEAPAAIDLAGRHVYVLQEGLDTVWGTYLFMVGNTGETPERATIRVMLPKETLDFVAQDGLEPSEIELGTDGGVVINKEFAPGDSLLAVGFQVPASMGVAELTMTPPFDVSNFSVFSPKGDLKLGEVPRFELQKDVPFSGRVYDTLSGGPFMAGDHIQLKVMGVPEGRGRFWSIGIGMAVLLAFAGAFLAWRTRPKISEADGQLSA